MSAYKALALGTRARVLWQRRPAVDLVLGLTATLFGLGSLSYPLGRDQGLFFYVAREWLQRDQLLYRDVFEIKPPVIYMVYRFALTLLGEHAWSIRALELFAAVPLLAWLSAWLMTARGQRPQPGSVGAAWFAISVLNYGYWSFWDSAQTEQWGTLFALAAVVCARHVPHAGRAALASGALSAVALFAKPSFVFFVLIAAAASAWRGVEEAIGKKASAGVRALCWFTLGGAVVCATIIGYFAQRGALAAMIDVLVGANAVYLRDERTIHSLHDVVMETWRMVRYLRPFSWLFIAFVVLTAGVGLRTKDRALLGMCMWPVLLTGASFCAVLAQLKFWNYHWGTLCAATGTFGVACYAALTRSRLASERAPSAALSFAALLAGGFLVAGDALHQWSAATLSVVRYRLGLIDSDEFALSFHMNGYFDNQDAQRVGSWLRQNAAPEDTLVVRGFEPEIYAAAGLHYTGRFFWTAPLTSDTRVYRRQEWLDEDLAALQAKPPRFAVTLKYAVSEINSPRWFEKLGYAQRTTIGPFGIMERRDP